MDLVTHVVEGAAAQRMLLLVHGFGADERDLAQLVPYLDDGGHLSAVLPRGPVSAGAGFAWYTWDPSGSYDSEQFAAALDALDDLLDAECAARGFERSEAIVGGFSQGAGLALAVALRTSERPRPIGVLAMSPVLPDLDAIGVEWSRAKEIPVLVQHGTDDPLVPVASARALARTLSGHGVPVVYTEYPMQHQVALDSVRDARAWLDEVFAGERPDAPVPDDAPEGPVKPVTTATFEAEVLRSDVPVIVDFWAPWCAPCRQVAPIVQQIALMREGSYRVVKVNIDEEPALAQQYGVQSIPMIGLFRNGRLERSSLGAKPRPQLEAELGMLVIP